jgi:hypothetical protein
MTPYRTRTEAQEYFDTRLHTEAWDNTSNADRDKALLHATAIINNLNFIGDKDDEDQENEFPRDDEDTPTAILDACCDIALALCDGIDPEKEMADLSAISQGYSSVRSTYDRGIVQEHIAAGVPSAVAWSKLRPFLRDGQFLKLSRVS